MVRFGGFDISLTALRVNECERFKENSVRFSVKLRSTAVLVDPGGCCLPGTGKWCEG